MFSNLKPIMSALARGGMSKIVEALGQYIILWAVSFVACIFVIFFLNVAIFVLLVKYYGLLTAALALLGGWTLVFVLAISWAKNKTSNMKNNTDLEMSNAFNRHREMLVPIAMTALPILKKRKGILRAAGGVVAAVASAAIYRLVMRRR